MTSSGTVRQVVRVARDRELTFMAAAITYYALASIVPLLLLALALGTLLGGDALVESVIRDRLGSALSGSAQDVLLNLLTGVQGQIGASLVGIVVAFWSGSKIFRGLDIAFTNLYEDEADPSLLRQFIDAAVVIALLVLSVAAIVAVSVVVSVGDLPIASPALVGSILLLVALVVVLLPLYYVLPPVDETLRGVLPGSIVAAVGFIVLQNLFVLYTQYAGRYKALGIIGALLLFVTWLYFGGIVVLLGGALNYVLEEGDDQWGTSH